MTRAGFVTMCRALSVSVMVFGVTSLASAADLGLIQSTKAAPGNCSDIVLTCENGREYPMCPIAVSVVGEVVTASLYIGPHRPSYVRLVPMGVGYRYAGKGVWFDGLRGNGVLNFGNASAVACNVVRS